MKGYGIEGKGYESFWYFNTDNKNDQHFLFKNLYNVRRDTFRRELDNPVIYTMNGCYIDNPNRSLTKYNKFHFDKIYKQYISEIITNIIKIHMNKKENLRKFSIFTSRINKYSIIVSHFNNIDSIYGIDQDNNNIINKFKYDLSTVDNLSYLTGIMYYIENFNNGFVIFLNKTDFIKIRIILKNNEYIAIYLTNKLKIYNG